MARYIPTDHTARVITREYISVAIRSQFERGTLSVTIGELNDDGSCPVFLQAQQEEFDFRSMLAAPQIDGAAWVDASNAQVDWDFGSALQPYAFLREHGGVA